MNNSKSKSIIVFWMMVLILTNVSAVEYTIIKEWNSLADWTATGNTIQESPAGQLNMYTTSATNITMASTVTVPSTYYFETKFKVDSYGGAQGFRIDDGAYRLQVEMSTSGVTVRTPSGYVSIVSWSSDINWHDYKFEVNKGVARLYFDGIDKGTWSMYASTLSDEVRYYVGGTGTVKAEIHVDYTLLSNAVTINEAFTSAAAWTLSGTGTKEINPSSQLHLKNTSGYVVNAVNTTFIPHKFTAEVRYKVDSFGGDQGFKINTGTHRLFVKFYTDGVIVSNDLFKIKDWSSDTAWHTYKFEVDKGFARVYVDGVYKDYYVLPENTDADAISFWVGKNSVGESHVDWINVTDDSTKVSKIYTYTDNFGTDSGAWWETSTAGFDTKNYSNDKWTIYNDSGNMVLKSDNGSSDSGVLLYTSARDVSFETKFKVVSSSSSTKMSLLTRWNRSDSYLNVNYDFSDNKWRIIAQQYEKASVVTLATSGVVTYAAGWHTAKVEVVGNLIKLYVDGNVVPSVSAYVTKDGLGKVGLNVANGVIYFDDVSYSGEGRVNEGIREVSYFTDNTDNGSDIMKLSNGTYLMRGDSSGTLGGWESTDNGATWSFVAGTTKYAYLSKGFLVLANGDLLSYSKIENSTPGTFKYGVYKSTNNGSTWSGPYFVQSSWELSTNTMPGKMMQASSGRIFFCVGAGDEDVGGNQVYYSDDGGVSWTSSQTKFDQATFSESLQEVCIVETGTNTFKAFMRSDGGYLKSSTSTNNGVTWSTPTNQTDFESAQSTFGFRTDPITGYHYIAWSYADIDDYPAGVASPRNRLSIAVSKDNCNTWGFLGDLDIWINKINDNQNIHRNTALNIIGGKLWVVSARRSGDAGQYHFYNTAWEVDLSKIDEYNKFPGVLHIDLFKN